MSNKDEYVIGIQICKRRGGYLTDYGGFNIGGDLKESLFRVKEFMSDWKMLINSNHGWVYLTDDGRVLTSGHTVTPNYPKFTKLDIIFSKKIGVNEGFFTKVRDKINKLIKPEEPNRISKKEFEYTLDDCFIDLKDNGFIIDIKQTKTRMRPSVYKGQMLHMREYESFIYFIQIKKEQVLSKQTRIYDIGTFDTINVPVYENPKFKFGEIKDVLLFTMDTIKSMYGIDIFNYRPNIENKDEDEEYSVFEIEFEIPVSFVTEKISYDDIDDTVNNIKDIFIDLSDEIDGQWFDIDIMHPKDISDTYFNVQKESIYKFQRYPIFKDFDREPCDNISDILITSITPQDENAPSGYRLDFRYDYVKDDVERCIEYMSSNGWWYIIEPVWEGSPGMQYSIKTSGKFSDKLLHSLHIKFYK